MLENYKKNIRKKFDGAARFYRKTSDLQKITGEQLLALANLTTSTPTVVDIGCGTASYTHNVFTYFKAQLAINLDISENMLQQAKTNISDGSSICADFDNLPFANSTVNLFFSNMALQWSKNLDLTLKEIYRCLADEGYLLFSMPAEQTLSELRDCWKEIDNNNHVNNFYALDDIKKFLLKNNFQIITLTNKNIIRYYDSVLSLMRNLKGTGASYVFNTNNSLCGKNKMQTLMNNYAAFKTTNNNYPATYEIIYCLAKRCRHPERSERSQPVDGDPSLRSG